MRWAIVALMLVWTFALQVVGPLTPAELFMVCCAFVGVNIVVQAIQHRQARKLPRLSETELHALVDNLLAGAGSKSTRE